MLVSDYSNASFYIYFEQPVFKLRVYTLYFSSSLDERLKYNFNNLQLEVVSHAECCYYLSTGVSSKFPRKLSDFGGLLREASLRKRNCEILQA